jgi:hypothetical protein
MEPTAPIVDSERLLALARTHCLDARWDEALAAIEQLRAAGHSSAELDELRDNIRLKQRMEAAQLPTFAAPPRRRGPALPLLGGAAALTLALAFALAGGLQSPPPAPEVAALSRSLVGALPTPAPPPQATAAPAPDAPRPGAVAVRADSEIALGVSNVYLILDASGSMLARSGERRKIELAQEALVGLAEALPTEVNVALRAYGHRRPDDCTDSQLLAAPGPFFREALVAQIRAVQPVNLGRTPIAASLEAAAADLAAAPGETLVVLVSDGEESCEGDPVAAAAALHGARPEVRVSVVGFDIAPELRERLAAIAAAGGGEYLDAADLDELTAALQRVATPGFRLLDAEGAEVGAGSLGEQLALPAGAYTLLLGQEPALLRQQLEVRPGMTTLVTIDDLQGSLSADVRRERQP